MGAAQLLANYCFALSFILYDVIFDNFNSFILIFLESQVYYKNSHLIGLLKVSNHTLKSDLNIVKLMLLNDPLHLFGQNNLCQEYKSLHKIEINLEKIDLLYYGPLLHLFSLAKRQKKRRNRKPKK